MINEFALHPADVLIPKNTDLEKWCVVACDQYTSQQKYWNEVSDFVGDNNSTLNLIFPEIYLENDDFDSRITSIKSTMYDYLSNNIFNNYPEAYICVKRTLADGKIRNGIIGMIDLECYDYEKGSQNLVRATEGTVIERIPPRVKIRKDCPLEVPHIMLLIDDESKSVIEPIANSCSSQAPIYSTNLMQNSGSICGYLLGDEAKSSLESNLIKLADNASFCAKYNVKDKPSLLFAVGDGNHSLATAKKCYENIKEKIGENARSCPARYALVEIVNLHDSSLEFEAIHRVLFNVDPVNVMKELRAFYETSELTATQNFKAVIGNDITNVGILNPSLNLTVGSLQNFIDYYLQNFGGKVDYIHGEDVVKNLCAQNQNSVGFILQCINKNDLFKTVILDGALPRKTFSMGQACDKRFYLESRKII
ncbi:MAG: DUF1015 domain-containing protein [Oscillospiraceae bacterium]